MEYFLIASVLLFLPGIATAYILGLDRYRYLLGFSLSYSIFVLLIQSMPLINIDSRGFTYAYLLVILLLLLIASLKFYFKQKSAGKKINTEIIQCYGCNRFAQTVPVFIVVLLGLYFLQAGAYIELPSDTFSHLEYMQELTRSIVHSEAEGVPLQQGLGLNGKYWYYLTSFISIWGGVKIADSILSISYFNVSAFMLAVFFFSQVVFRNSFKHGSLLVLASIAAVFFTFFHFGINIFSFIRYYALAPALLNFVLYFALMAIIIDFFRDEGWQIKYLMIAVVIFVACLHIHRQEGLFVVLMFAIMSFYLFVQKHFNALKLLWQGQGRIFPASPVNFLSDKVNLSFLFSQMTIVSLFIYSYLNVRRGPVLEPKIIPLENIVPFVKNLYILNPTYQFYYVITLWGSLVVLLFILNVNKLKGNAYLMAGMLSPFFTVFNPFFVDLFLRHSYSLLLWRMSFLVPLHLAAAYLFVLAVQYIQQGGYLKKAYGLISIILLITTLFPFKTLYIENTYSRMPTLQAVPAANSPEYWGDLIEYLDGIDDEKKIITDPVTGYMITAMTKHVSSRAKFHRKYKGYIKFNYEDYSGHPFDRYRGYLFVINKRNGNLSENGRIARHWPENILQVGSYYYSEGFEDYVQSNPGRFRLLWEQDKIRVYLIGGTD